MSVKLTFVSPGDGGGISRSCSFTGFSTVQSRKLAKSLSRGSVRSRMSLKPPKAYNSLQKGALIWDPKPLQVKKIFEALKKGLNEYLEAHQAELDFLSDRHKDTKRNSRLQIRSVERYIRKLEFHISKVEELYEAYCIQCRLRDGATNMKQAFSLSPATKASRDSLLELYRNVQECTEDMCFIEGALEVHLGEFHVKMKGNNLGHAVTPTSPFLCGLQVFVRLGRQKWRLKGKIETDDSQTWDEEEKIFIPNLHEKFEIKVTELRGLATILVGVVTCDSINFFTTKPQAILVDITELGTIKLRLEVLWNPFDTENLFLSPGSTAKFSVGSRKSSLYNWTPPNTPSFRERYYLVSTGRGKAEHRLWAGSDWPGAQPASKVETAFWSSRLSRTRALCLPLTWCSWGWPQQPSKPSCPQGSLPGHRAGLSLSPQQSPGEGQQGLQVKPLEKQIFLPLFHQQLKTLPKHSSMESLMVETVLESFDFLNTDCSADELSLFGSIRTGSVSRAEAQDVTTGDDNLDTLLITHLRLCKGLLQVQGSLGVSRALQANLLPDSSWEIPNLPELADFLKRWVSVIQKTKKKKQYLKIWSDLAEAENYPWRLLEQILTCEGLLPSPHLQTEPVTLFQFYRYLERHHISSLEKHLAKLAKEVMLIEELQCPGRLKTLKKLKGKRLNRLQPLPRTLRLLGVSPPSPSIEQVAHLCQSETEEVRNAARETTLSFGERGRQAFEKMDRICCELRETAQEAEIEITVF
uniref:RIPOR family member 3 n=1 Tax=Zosterops lateralis melanops TaxID=1220523 RepID=A0A8D2PIA0_ZOSLA